MNISNCETVGLSIRNIFEHTNTGNKGNSIETYFNWVFVLYLEKTMGIHDFIAHYQILSLLESFRENTVLLKDLLLNTPDSGIVVSFISFSEFI